ncbi:MAG: hypothetical protein CMQ33_13505 [Gammaproteobacteria bacterium]|jgi:microcin C transport system substrate-binding protein|nr:hypothetical protein [Gammaproteobacteria bacterium]
MNDIFRHQVLYLLILVFLTAVPKVRSDSDIDYKHGISLMEELKYTQEFTHFEYLNPDAPKGGLLNLMASGSIKNFTWNLDAVVESVEGLWRTYDRLIVRSGDELASYYGLLAEGIALSQNKKSLFLKLNADARWHDGEPITAVDVKYTFDRAALTLDGRVFLQWLESVEIINEHEVVLHHKEVYTNASLLVISGQIIMPEHYWRNKDPTQTHATPSVGSGPYRVAAYNRAFVLYERIDDYWGQDLPVVRGQYNFDQIRHEVYRDITVAREAFLKGLLDVQLEGDIRYWTKSLKTPLVQNGSIQSSTFRTANRIGAQFVIAFNADSEMLSDVRVREALTLAMDFSWQERALYHNMQSRVISYFQGSVFASSGLPTGAELKLLEPHRDQLPDRLFSQEFELPKGTGYGKDRRALIRARELLTEAGWHINRGRLVNTEGKPLEFEIMNYNSAFQRVLLPYTETLKRLGIKANIRLMDSAQFIRRRRARDFEALIWPHDLLAPPTTHLRSYFHSWAANRGMMTYNITNIRHPTIDSLVESAERATSLTELTAATRAIDRVLQWNYYNILLNGVDKQRFLHWDKFGRPKREDLAVYGWPFVEGWWFDNDKASRLPTIDDSENATSAPQDQAG